MNKDFLLQSQGTALYSAETVRAIDQAAIAADVEANTPGLKLMQRAAQAALNVVRQQWPQAASMVVVCGAGNNAGDGYLLASLAKKQGMRVQLHAAAPQDKLSGDAAAAAQVWLQAGGKAEDLHPPYHYEDYDVVVDALCGTGLNRRIEGRFLQIIESINLRSGKGVVALDIPSGLNANTGAAQPIAVIADITVSFVAMKTGLLTGDAADHCGEIYLDTLDVAAEHYAKPNVRCMSETDIGQLARPRQRNSHKNTHGHVLLVGGDAGMSGALRMAAEAALGSGAGLTTIATHPAHAHVMNIGRPEIMAYAMLDEDDTEAPMQRADVLAVGPGLGQSNWSEWMFATQIESSLPLILDADALNWLAKEGDELAHTLRLREEPLILTPHPGEAARLLGTSVAAIQADRYKAARALHERFGAEVILKGAGTITATANGLALCPYGNPGMAVGGSGDVLTGILAGLLAQRHSYGISSATATELAVLVHALAGDKAAELGERGCLPSDVIAVIRPFVNGKNRCDG